MNDLFYGIAHLFGKCFRIIEKFHNKPNVLLIIIASVAMLLWLNRMAKYNKEADQNGTLR